MQRLCNYLSIFVYNFVTNAYKDTLTTCMYTEYQFYTLIRMSACEQH